MNTEYTGIIFMYLATVALAIPLGWYIAKVLTAKEPVSTSWRRWKG